MLSRVSPILQNPFQVDQIKVYTCNEFRSLISQLVSIRSSNGTIDHARSESNERCHGESRESPSFQRHLLLVVFNWRIQYPDLKRWPTWIWSGCVYHLLTTCKHLERSKYLDVKEGWGEYATFFNSVMESKLGRHIAVKLYSAHHTAMEKPHNAQEPICGNMLKRTNVCLYFQDLTPW